MTNPFAPNLVPPPREFSIRRAEEAVLRDRLKGPARILIEGPRRTGKSSLVRASVAEKELLAIDWNLELRGGVERDRQRSAAEFEKCAS